MNETINTFEKTVNKFIKWIVKKFDIAEEDNLIRDFQKETNTFIDPENQMKHEEREKECDLERYNSTKYYIYVTFYKKGCNFFEIMIFYNKIL